MEALKNGVLYTVLALVALMIVASLLAAAVRAVSLMSRRARHAASARTTANPVTGGPAI